MPALVAFTLDGGRYALHLPVVARVVRAVEISPLPGAPDIVLGIINVHGRVVPVMDVRARFRLPARDLDPDQQMILARTRAREVVFVVDSVSGVVECPDDLVVAPAEVAGDVAYVAGIAKLEDGLTLIHDLETFLSPEEEQALNEALADHEK
jgi:purine-binding chemotaxis protein CheW